MPLLTGCRSEQTAFQFQPAPRLLARLDTAPTKRPGPPVVVRQSAATRPLTLIQQRTEVQSAGKTKSQCAKVVKAVGSPKTVVQHVTAPRQLLSAKGSFLQILGTGVFVAGIVAGLVVGSWAGFGIFALGSVVGLLLAFWGSFIIDGNLP
ncbi:TMEM198/TM7SF3 family protein [Hymenobacter lucidus]|uniref:TMEM198/TM7SF3 family protein n=1 Tax=Hymenobacter lucidus TaxID=2880930 RepID=A0ABS8ANP3_9BACT|nr:TMEM198/TM7SF3 family protein [Hymenobacter lucidus]MCB2406622.1 TMEM198/TM7SF3 family protein [Hymenobacter lucidus]